MSIPMTPEQIADLDGRVCQLPVIKRLEENDASIIHALDSIKEDMDSRFEKGARRMDGIEDELKSLKTMISEGDRKRDEQHANIMNKMDQKENERLKEELLRAIESKRAQDNRIWDVTKIVIGGALTILIGAYMVVTGIK